MVTVDFVKQIQIIGVRAREKQAIIARVVFWLVLALFVGEALSVALTAMYPLPIDEPYHFGLIQFFSHQWLPFVHVQPADTYQYGDITHYDSYLYHYLMSFPLRIIELFTHDQQAQVVLLRILNIGIFAGAFVLLRRILRDLKVNQWIINLALLFYALLPMAPFLAAHVNYDSLFTLALMVFVRLGQRVIMLSRHDLIPRRLIITFLSVGLLGCLVKYSFLPVAFVGIIIVGSCLLRHHKNISRRGVKTYDSHERLLLVGVGILLIVSGGLFVQRYGVNLVEYRAIEPDCARIHKVDQCQYGPWLRNYELKQKVNQSPRVTRNPLRYFKDLWLPVSVQTIGAVYDKSNKIEPLSPIMKVAVWSTAVGIIIVLLASVRSIIRDRVQLFVVGISVAYVATLFLNNFAQFEEFRYLVAVQGRYILPFFPLLLGIVLWKIYLLLRFLGRRYRASNANVA